MREAQGPGIGTHQIQPESQWESLEHLPNESIIWVLIIAHLIDPPSGICWEGRRQGEDRVVQGERAQIWVLLTACGCPPLHLGSQKGLSLPTSAHLLLMDQEVQAWRSEIALSA